MLILFFCSIRFGSVSAYHTRPHGPSQVMRAVFIPLA